MRKTAFILALFLCAALRAATITGPLTQANINAAAGGTLDVSAGTFNLTSPITVPSGTTIQGAANFGSHVVFAGLSGNNSWGFVIAGNASGVTLAWLDLHSNSGLVKGLDGSKYTNLHLVDDQFQYGGGSYSGGAVGCINITVSNSGTQITHDLFHDSPASNRNWFIFNASSANLDFNVFSNVFDGGQLQYPGANDSFSYNFATGLQNKMQEGDISGASNLQVIGNVAYGWKSTNASSMILSLLSNTAKTPAAGWPVEFKSNWGQLALANGAAGGRSGVGFEVGGGPVDCTGNTVGVVNGPAAIQTDTPGSTGSGNKAFGNFAAPAGWGAYATQAGPSGAGGRWAGSIGTATTSLAGMGAAPTNSFAGPAFYPGNAPVVTPPVNPPVPSGVGSLTLTANPTDDGVTVSWGTLQLTNLAFHCYTPTQNCGTLAEAGPASGAMFSNLNSEWGYSLDVTGVAAGKTYAGTVKFSTTGDPSPAGTTATNIEFAPVPPSIVGVETIIIDHLSNGTEKTVSDVTTTP